MKILVIGGTGGIGRQTVEAALARGHSVRVLARSADEMSPREGLEPVAGDATVLTDVLRAVDGVDAVVHAIGIPTTIRALAQPTTLFSDSTRVAIAAMEDLGVRRLLAVTGVGTGASAGALSGIERIGRDIVMGRAYADKAVQEDLIHASGLDWTIARPGILTNAPGSGAYRVLTACADWRNGVVSRADVADFLIRAAEDGSYLHEAPILVR